MLTLRSSSTAFWERNAPRAFALSTDDPMLSAWQRSARLGVRPEGAAPPEGVGLQTLQTLRASLDEVCTLGGKLLEPIAHDLAQKNLVALLSNSEGTILLARGGGSFARTAARTRLEEGAHWSETIRGTNAIGTALALGTPVAVVGSAHFERVNHGLFCYAVPIRNPDGEVVAVFDVTGRLEDEDPFAEVAVTSFAYRLEDALRGVARARTSRPSLPAPAPHKTPVDPFGAIVGDDASLVASVSLARRVAASDLPVLLLAETGTGKELLARAIHHASPRASHAFVPLNCGAVSPTLLESELFGFAAGSFTGARPGGHDGKVGAAKGGTLFLDEIAEMPPPLQAMLLRLLDDGTYYRVGESRERQADLRLICATCRDLPAMVRAGTFRADLFFRIKGATLALPSLRARTDRVLLARALLARLSRDAGVVTPSLSPEAIALISSSEWPGNVRELRMALEYARVLAAGAETLLAEQFPQDLVSLTPSPSSKPVLSRSEVERDAVESAVESAQGNLSEAARRLGVARSTLYRLLRRYGNVIGRS